MDRIHTTADWMEALAAAGLEGDMEAIDRLDRISEGWLQTSHERRGQLLLLETVRELMHEAGYR